MIDRYSILGLDRDSTREDVRNAYRRLAKQYHPDVNKSPDAPERFRRISEAYEHIIKVMDGEQPDIQGSDGRHTRAGTYGSTHRIRPLEEIMAALNSDDMDIVIAAIESLGSRRFYENHAIITVLNTYLRSQDVLLRRSAVVALGRLGNPVAIPDLARLLKDDEAHIRFDAVVALGNIGVPAALSYLEMMDRDDPQNNRMVINARDESVYWIKKKNRMYDQSRKCPSCGGYDSMRRSGPFRCHECEKSFGDAAPGPRAADKPPEHMESDRVRTGEGSAWDEDHPGIVSPHNSKAVRNLAILAVMLFLLLVIGAIVILYT